MIQDHAQALLPGASWEHTTASRHFENCLRHPIGLRFEGSARSAERNAGLSVITCSGTYFANASVYEQMRFIMELHEVKGGYHWTRLDAQVTTLTPSQSAEQIIKDIQDKKLWIKGYQGWQPKGLRNFEGESVNGMTAHFGSPTSDRQAKSYNKAAEQGWETAARRDEVVLRGDWAEAHMTALATAIAGAASETEAIEKYQATTAAAIAQHMQYLDITGTAVPRPKDWARGKKAPKWWSETLETKHTPLKITREPNKDVFARLNHMRKQWGPTWAEGIAELVISGKSDTPEQATFDLAMSMLSALRPEHVERALERVAESDRPDFLEEFMKAANDAALHTEHTR